MQKKYASLGLMSGTSGDGVDASLIISNGINQFEVKKNKYFEYDSYIFKKIHDLKDKIHNLNDLEKLSDELKNLERKITLFHAKVINEFKTSNEDFLVGFHGQTIYHNSDEKISKQLGDGRLLNQLTKKNIIFNFRENDILNGGEGAPLSPLFHQLIVIQKKVKLPVCILNIGGISNVTIIKEPVSSFNIFSRDIGPGNCLIDNWVRKNSDKKFDYNGEIAKIGNTNEIILEQAQELFSNRKNKEKNSFDTNDFDISFSRGLSLEDGAATLTDFTAGIIGSSISSIHKNVAKINKILICGGGRKNKILLKKIIENISPNLKLKLIDEFGIDGDFVESQAFGFLAIRSFLQLPITFPSTTGCKEACLGGTLITS